MCCVDRIQEYGYDLAYVYVFGLSHRGVISRLSILCLDINEIAPIKKGMMQNMMDRDRNIDDCNVIAFDQICTQNV